jgi:hypothetical protein
MVVGQNNFYFGKKTLFVATPLAIFKLAIVKLAALLTRVARFFLVHDTKTGKNVPNEHKMYQMVIKYPKWLQNIPNGHKI